MRTKKFKLLIAFILILALCFTFVACVPNDDDTDGDETPATVLVDEMVNKLTKDLTITNTRRLNIDISGTATLNELNGENPTFWKYELVAKGNIALTADAKEMDSNFRIELNSFTKDNLKANLFSLLYESEVDENNKYLGSYFYLTLPGQELPIKINAIALLKLIPGVDETAEPISISDYLGLGLSVLAKSGERVGTDSYKFTTDMSMIWELVQEFVVPALKDPATLNNLIPGLGIDLAGMLDSAVPILFEGLTYKVTDDAGTETDKTVSTISDLLEYIGQNLPNVEIAMQFNFNGNNFTGGTVVADYSAKDEVAATHKFNLDLHTATIGAGKYIAYDEGYSLTPTARKEMAASSNLLTFSVDGKMNFVKGDKVTPYTITLNSDINPLILIGDAFSISKLNDIGKLSLTVVDDSTGATVLTLYINGAEKELIVSYASPGAYLAGVVTDLEIYIGGEFTFEALGAIINAMTPATAASTNMSDEAAGTDAVGDIMAAVINSLDFAQMSTKGLIINDVKSLLKVVFSNIDLGLGDSTDLVVDFIHGGVFNNASIIEIGVKEDGFKYGVCNLINKNEIVLPGNLEATDTYNELLDDTKTVSSPDVQTTYEFGESFKLNTRGGSGAEAKHTFTLAGKNRAGENANFSAVYYGQTGFDPNKVGTQKVTIYYGINSRLTNLLNNTLLASVFGNLSQMLPLFGAHMYTVDVTVYPKIADENVVLIIDGTTSMFADESVAANLDATLRYRDYNGNIREIKVTDDMISCKKPVMDNGKIMYFGNYTIDINYKGIIINQNVTINEIAVKQPNKAKVGKTLLEQISFKMKSISASGEVLIEDVELTIERLLDLKDNVLDGIVDADGKILGLMANTKKSFKFEMSFMYNGEKRLTYIYFNGTNAAEDYAITDISTSSASMASNAEIVDAKFAYLNYLTRSVKDANGKDVKHFYNIVFDAAANKLKLVPYMAISPEWDPADLKLSLKFVQTHRYDVATSAFVELEQVGEEFELSADKLTLGVGQYKLTTGFDNAYSYNDVKVTPMVVFKDTKNSSGYITNTMTLNISAVKFKNAPATAKNVLVRWDASTKKFGLYIASKDGTANVYTLVDDSDIKFEYTAEMYKDGTWQAATYADSNGAFASYKDSMNRSQYYAHKVNIKITMSNGTTFEGVSNLNTNNLSVVA